jgi:trk system potassium uptake protein TrkH
MSKLNKKLIFYILGLLLIFNGFAMLISAFVSYLTNDGVLNEMTLVSLLVIFLGWILMAISKNNDRKINKRDAYFIVVLGWLTMVFSGMLPYIVTESISSFSNVFLKQCLVIPQRVQQ